MANDIHKLYEGKTIATIKKARHREYIDDKGYFILYFTDGSWGVIVSTYGDFSENNKCDGEYPTDINFVDYKFDLSSLEIIQS